MFPSILRTSNSNLYDLRREPVIAPPRLYYLLGDEKLSKYNYKSRTSASDWGGGPQTPSVMKFQPTPTSSGIFQVNISGMLSQYLKLNGEVSKDDKKTRYLFSKTTALFNSAGYPKQENLTMQGNKLEPIEIHGSHLKFKTLKPSDIVAGMTYETHPWFVHRFDLVCYNKDRTPSTFHKPNTPQGIIYYYLVTNEGYAYIPLAWVGAI